MSLRDFIRQALDLDPIPPGLSIPPQGPARPGGGGGKAGKNEGARDDPRQGGGKTGNAGTGAGGAGAGMGLGAGMALGDEAESRR